MAVVFAMLAIAGLWCLARLGRWLMETNCERCTNEVDDDEVDQCDECGRDGLCPDCAPHYVHANDEGDDDE